MSIYDFKHSRRDIDDLVAACDQLCKTLGEMAAQEKRFCRELCEGFDMMSWEAYKMSNDIKFITERYGVV